MPLTRRGDVLIVPTPGHTPHHVSVVVCGDPSFLLAGDTSYNQRLLLAGKVDGVSPDPARQPAERSHAYSRSRTNGRWSICRPMTPTRQPASPIGQFWTWARRHRSMVTTGDLWTLAAARKSFRSFEMMPIGICWERGQSRRNRSACDANARTRVMNFHKSQLRRPRGQPQPLGQHGSRDRVNLIGQRPIKRDTYSRSKRSRPGTPNRRNDARSG